mgnify:CR=1 FL=1
MSRVIAGMICFTAFFGVAIGLGAWLPNMMNAQGFSVEKAAVRMPEGPLKRVGDFPLVLALYLDVTANITVSVIGEQVG